MNFSFIILLSILILTILAPFISLYAVSLIKKNQHQKHIKIQKGLFWICVTGVLVLELQIRLAGGSGGLVKDSPYLHTSFFKTTLTAHIIGAILTYIIWAITIFTTSRKYKKKINFPGSFSAAHKRLGVLTIVGLFYTAITAFMVFYMAFL